MRIATAVLIVAFSVSQGLSQTAKPADVTVTLKKLYEKREMSIEKSMFSGFDNGIELTLHIDGPDVQGARKYGKLAITKAVDDAGTDLAATTKDSPRRSDDFEEVREQQTMGMSRNQPKPTGFDIQVNLPTKSVRNAKAIAQLTGSFQVLVGGDKKIVEVKPIKVNFGKTLDDPALKSVGVVFTLDDPSKPGMGGLIMGGNTGKNVAATLSGNIDALASVQILDAAGKKVNQGSMWSDSGATRKITYDLSKPLSDDMTLQIEVWPGQKTLTVPIELKNVALP